MHFYDVGYGSYEDSSYYQYCHETAFTKEQFDQIIEDCLVEALHTTFPSHEGHHWYWPPNFSDVLGTHAFHNAVKKRGFTPIQFHQRWDCMGWGAIDDPSDWSESNKEILDRLLPRIPKHPRANIRPLPPHIGFGFTSKEPIPADLAAMGYRYEQQGYYHNYFFTPQAPYWPVQYPFDSYKMRRNTPHVLDGFSPNLNKKLHAGHLKGLVIAAALKSINSLSPVAMLGASLGIQEGAREELERWYKLAKYEPYKIFLDTELPPPKIPLIDGEGEYAGCKLWMGPNGPVVIYKSDGKPTYAAHDLAFSQDPDGWAPTVYLTGAEQKEHFKSLGLGDKHHSIGLLLGSDGTKMRSRDGNVVTAAELFEAVKAKLRPIDLPAPMCACYHPQSEHLPEGMPGPKCQAKSDCTCDGYKTHPDQTFTPTEKLAWNILVWQFGSAEKSSDTRFDLEQWSNPSSPGMQISYTYARFASVLWSKERLQRTEPDAEISKEPPEEVLPMLAMSQYYEFWLHKSREAMEPYILARYTYDLCLFMNDVYQKVRLSTAEGWTLKALSNLLTTLKWCMESLGMYTLETV